MAGGAAVQALARRRTRIPAMVGRVGPGSVRLRESQERANRLATRLARRLATWLAWQMKIRPSEVH